tara:strand:- start:1829 stop:2380 length:552 start_codon:yes stop_codon:yes gene_type:complete
MIIILEGPDCSGKTTLAKYLLTSLKGDYNYIHNSLDENKNFVWRDLERNIIKKHSSLYDSHLKSITKHKNVIVDRLWPSELVYGSLFRSKLEYSIPELRKEIQNYKTLYIGCLPPKHLVEKYHKRRLYSNEEDFNTVSSVYDLYECLFNLSNEFLIFDYEIESIEKFTRRLTNEYKQCLATAN